VRLVDRIDRDLQRQRAAPEEPGALARWLDCADALEFMTSVEDQVPIYVNGPNTFVYALFVPLDRLTGGYGEDLLDWNFGVSRGWGAVFTFGEQPTVEVGAPMDGAGSAVLDGAEPLLYLRDFDTNEPRSYVELDQRFAHVVDVHWVPRAGAWCQLDANGDLEQVIQLLRRQGTTICTASSLALGAYMLAARRALVRVFDVTRFVSPEAIRTADRSREVLMRPDLDLYLRRGRAEGAGYARGAQVIQALDSPERLRHYLRRQPMEEPCYQEFLIQDFKNGSVRTWTCDPAQLGNYFVDSDLPLETSPVYFRPDVLARYKQDPDKFRLEAESITCRGAWHLQRYGVNEAGQVFTYIVYLGRLPPAEQV
jgi:hypothetical protein